MTKQEYYDLLVRSATDGTFPSAIGESCMYRLDGTAECKQRCAVGILISDDKYTRKMEHKICSAKSVRQTFGLPEGITIDNIRAVQENHDDLARIEPWDANRFIKSINTLSFFQDVVQQGV